jgi:formylmethanofuran dehydrogenase subunit E
MDKKALWEKAAAFHGHVCPGLTIGFRAALYAIDLLGITFSEDEQLVCITENDACGVDAIQAVLGCSIGKGNLLFHMTGKQAFSFYNRKTGKSVRLVLRKPVGEMSREETLKYYTDCKQEEMFDVKETKIEVPEHARIFESYTCECCGESTGANWIRIFEGKKVCTDCYKKYDRFNV